jgi:peptidoglycan glycosyltransferase
MDDYRKWRAYQRKLQKEALRKSFLRRNRWLFVPAAVLFVLGAQLLGVNLSTGSFTKTPSLKEHLAEESDSAKFAKKDFWSFIDRQKLLDGSTVRVDYLGKPYTLETTIDAALQRYMSDRLQAAKSPLVGFVAIDPANGHVLSLIDRSNMPGVDSVCLSGQFPAASIFKIVSAAAAIEGCAFRADTPLTYSGRKHTLYRKQLTDRKSGGTNQVSLQDAFALSINPTFGKLGIFRLKKDLLEEYAARFGFNEPIDFELRIESSRFSAGDDPYQWAEMASGFNRKTVISPIHGAMIAAAVLNGGKLLEPTIVKTMASGENEPVYCGNGRIMRQMVSPETSREMKKLMEATISRGTSRRAFRGYRRDRVLSKLSLGGKTGSIKNESDELFYDWFVGFGADKNGGRQLALAVLVVHDNLVRTRAQEFARLALRHYFEQPSSGRS